MTPPPFDTVLVANRGEIALRVARTCQEMGIRVVAVHSTQDREAASRFADETVQIGPAPARRSYLAIPRIIEAARRSGASAVHPGYGFLAEDADFAEVCQDHGLTFIGPPPRVIRQLGDKIQARSLMAKAGLPVLPGSAGPVHTAQEVTAAARQAGFPVILKAAAGGGGRGMRVVRDPAELVPAYLDTTATARTLFGDGGVYVERYLDAARHVEIQVLCDQYGNGVHLGERDCSVQRRHQKLVEESPAPALPASLAERMGQAALAGARAAGYVGAGTFEFLVDPVGEFFFIEVNCRIQVEHPVTEMVTGVDLVREQILVAAGESLRLRQQDVVRRGVAIECRVNVEDPERGFAPTPGVLTEFVPPGGPFVRVDTHGHTGYRVPAAYDSLLAKVVVWAPDRMQALGRMRRALGEFRISGPGVRTTAGFLRDLLDDPRFRAGAHDTSLVPDLLARGEQTPAGDPTRDRTA